METVITPVYSRRNDSHDGIRAAGWGPCARACDKRLGLIVKSPSPPLKATTTFHRRFTPLGESGLLIVIYIIARTFAYLARMALAYLSPSSRLVPLPSIHYAPLRIPSRPYIFSACDSSSPAGLPPSVCLTPCNVRPSPHPRRSL